MPADKTVIELYADGLISLAGAEDSLDAAVKDLDSALKILQSDAQISRFASDPTVTRAGKRQAVEQILGDQINPVVILFLAMLMERDRFGLLEDIAEMFFKKTSSLRDEVSGELITARPLNKKKVAEIEDEAGRVLGKKLHLRVTVDSELLGGMMIRAGDFVIDGTVDNQLEQLRDRIMA